MNTMHLSDIGTKLDLLIDDEDGNVLNISAATTKQIILTKADGVEVTKTAVFVTDGTDGLLRYVTIAGDIDVIGVWKKRAYVVTPSWTRHSSVAEFRVDP